MYDNFVMHNIHEFEEKCANLVVGGAGAASLCLPPSSTLTVWLPDVLPHMRFINRVTQVGHGQHLDALVASHSDS